MKLLPKNLPPESGKLQPYTVSLQVNAADATAAAAMKEALQSFVSHFSLAELQSAAAKLKNPVNRKAIKTFL